MRKKIIYKIIAIIFIFIFLFQIVNLAEGEKKEKIVEGNIYYYLLDEDDGTAGKDVNEIDWRIRGLVKDTLDSGESGFKKDKTYGWYIFNKDDTDWVVLRSMYTL